MNQLFQNYVQVIIVEDSKIDFMYISLTPYKCSCKLATHARLAHINMSPTSTYPSILEWIWWWSCFRIRHAYELEHVGRRGNP